METNAITQIFFQPPGTILVWKYINPIWKTQQSIFCNLKSLQDFNSVQLSYMSKKYTVSNYLGIHDDNK